MIDVKKLLTKIISKLREHEDHKVVTVVVSPLTVPAADADGPGELDVDFDAYYDSSEYFLWNVECVLGNYKLPYMMPNGRYTNISNITGSQCTITNNAGVWSNYTGYFTLTLRRRTI